MSLSGFFEVATVHCPVMPSLQVGVDNPPVHWIGLRENLQETMVFTIKYTGFL